MARRWFLAAAVVLFLGAGVWSIMLPPRLTCSSLGYPEGTRCREGRIDFEDHGPFVSVHVDARYGFRFAILLSGMVAGTLLLVVRDRVSPWRPQPEDGGAGL
jgi:hypothetical protein